MLGVALELAVGDGSFLERPEPPTRSFDCPRTRCPSSADGDEQDGGAHERDEQLGVDLGRQAADGSDERIVAPAQRPSLLVDGSPPSFAVWLATRAQAVSSVDPADHVGDQPPSVDPRDVEVGGRDRLDLARSRHRRSGTRSGACRVAVDRDLDLVRRVIRDPVVRRLRTRPTPRARTAGSLRCRPRSLPGPTVIVAFGAHRLIIRSMSFFVVASWKFFSIWSISQNVGLVGAVVRGFRARRSSRRRPRATSDEDTECAADQERPHMRSSFLRLAWADRCGRMFHTATRIRREREGRTRGSVHRAYRAGYRIA